jgi:hypothetical protein
MATKKQKRAEALAKRERFLEEQKRIGLEAQRQDKERRELREQRAKEEAERMNRRFQAILAAHLIRGDEL